jgi:predicted permease
MVFRGAEYVPIQTAPDLRVLGLTLAVSLAAALGFGLIPSIRSMRSEPAHALRGGSQSVKGSLSRRRLGLGHGLIVGQIALSLVLLHSAGLFGRSLANLNEQPLGFQREQVLVVSVEPGLAGYEYSQLRPLYERLHTRVSSLPGVTSAALSLYAPFTNCCWTYRISIQGYMPKPDEQMWAFWNRVSARYFETLGTKVLRGRPIDERDMPTAQRVAVVTEAFVRRYFPTENPIGKRFGLGDNSHSGDLEIIGVVEDAKYNSPRDEPQPMAFLPLLQVKPEEGESLQSPQYISNFVETIVVHTSRDPNAIAGDIRQALAEIDPNLPVMRINTLSSQIGRTLNQENAVAQLAGFFGLAALVLACVGLYGLMAYAVERRTSEIGIRMALGAYRGSVIGMVIREVLMQGIVGIVIGVAGALAAARLIANRLYGIESTDPVTLAAAALTLLLCITMAGYVPARRASRIDPIRALRHE